MITHDLNHDLIFYRTQLIVCATVDSQCLEYLGYITLYQGAHEKGKIYTSLQVFNLTYSMMQCYSSDKICQKIIDPVTFWKLACYNLPKTRVNKESRP